MRRESNSFEFEVPDEFIDDSGGGKRLVFHGPDRGHVDELIVSGYGIVGPGSLEERRLVKRRLLDGAMRAMADAGSAPDLMITQPLSRDPAIAATECWRLTAIAQADGVLFQQAACAGPDGVLLVTYETPNRAEFGEVFDGILQSIREKAE